jgi:hypothetical protein
MPRYTARIGDEGKAVGFLIADGFVVFDLHLQRAGKRLPANVTLISSHTGTRPRRLLNFCQSSVRFLGRCL